MPLEKASYYLKKQKKGNFTPYDKIKLAYIVINKFDELPSHEREGQDQLKEAQRESYQKAIVDIYKTFGLIIDKIAHEGSAGFDIPDGVYDKIDLFYKNGIYQAPTPYDLSKNFTLDQVLDFTDEMEESNVYIGPDDEKSVNEYDKLFELSQTNYTVPSKHPIFNGEEKENEEIELNDVEMEDEVDSPLSKKEIDKKHDTILKTYGNKAIGKEYPAEEVLNNLRNYRQHYAKIGWFTKLTSYIFGTPRKVVEDRALINSTKETLLKNGFNKDAINATDPKYTDEQFKDLKGAITSKDGLGVERDLAHSTVNGVVADQIIQYGSIIKEYEESVALREAQNKQIKNNPPINDLDIEEMGKKTYEKVKEYQLNMGDRSDVEFTGEKTQEEKWMDELFPDENKNKEELINRDDFLKQLDEATNENKNIRESKKQEINKNNNEKKLEN